MPGFNVLCIVVCIFPGRLQFKDVVTSVQQEVNRLRNDGVKFIIALGHAGFRVDLSVGQIPGVDVVVGGHTNTFLYTGRSDATATVCCAKVSRYVLLTPLFLCFYTAR